MTPTHPAGPRSDADDPALIPTLGAPATGPVRRSTQRRRASVAALTAAAAAVTGTLLSVPSASAVTDCPGADAALVSTRVRPAVVTVGITKAKKVTVGALSYTDCTITSIRADLGQPSRTRAANLLINESWDDLQVWERTVTLKPSTLDNTDAGRWSVRIVAHDSAGSTAERTSDLVVLRAARLSGNATPEPVRRGGTVTVTGRLTRADWDAGRYVSYPGQEVALMHYGSRDDDEPDVVGTDTTDARGRVTVQVPATRDGYYTLVFFGSGSTDAAASKKDFVDVR